MVDDLSKCCPFSLHAENVSKEFGLYEGAGRWVHGIRPPKGLEVAAHAPRKLLPNARRIYKLRMVCIQPGITALSAPNYEKTTPIINTRARAELYQPV